MFRYATLLSIAVLLALFPTPPAAAQPVAPAFRAGQCGYPGVTLPPEARCGVLSVPARHAAPDGPQIKLAVAILPASGPNPRPDPLVLAQGGPGGSTITDFAQFATQPSLVALRRERDLVLLEQRGTRFSEPALLCPENLALSEQTIGMRLSRTEANDRALAALGACRDRLAADGVDLGAYNSFENAADIAALTRALGVPQINLYGVSYGSLLTLHALRDHGELIRAAVIDAVVPTQRNFIREAPRNMDRAFAELFRACAAQPDCASAYPQLEQDFAALLDELDRFPARLTITDRESGRSYEALLDGDRMLNLTFQLMYVTDVIPLLPRLLAAARDGDFTAFAVYWPLLEFDRTFAAGMYFSTACAEDADFKATTADLEGLRPWLRAREERANGDFLSACARWNVAELGPEFDIPVTSAVPTLLLSGQFDPITPAANAEAAAKTLKNSASLTFPTAHGALLGSDCAGAVVLRFLDTLTPPAAPPCAAEPLRFVTRQTVIPTPAVGRVLRAFIEGSWRELLLFGGSLLVALSALLLWPLVWLIRRARGRTGPPDRSARLAPWLAALAALAGAALLAGFGYIGYLTTTPAVSETLLFAGVPLAEGWVLLIPPLIALLACIMLVCTINAWSRCSWHLALRVYYTLLTVAAAGMTLALYQFGLLTAFRGLV